MELEQLCQIENEQQRVNATYEIFHEDTRLNHSQAARVEFLTTVRFVEQYLKPGAKILDIGAGAGEYSCYFAARGYAVDALELADANVRAFRRKIRPDMAVCLRQGNALDMSGYADAAYDVVLLMGPLYHLKSETDRQRCIANAKRVCKPDGRIFFAFISNDMVILTEMNYDKNFFSGNTYDRETFQLEDFPFVFFTFDQMGQMLHDAGVQVDKIVATDGASELMADTINALPPGDYAQYLKYHFYRCEKPEMLGLSNHLLFIGR